MSARSDYLALLSVSNSEGGTVTVFTDIMGGWDILLADVRKTAS